MFNIYQNLFLALKKGPVVKVNPPQVQPPNKKIPTLAKFLPSGSLQRNAKIFFWAELETISQFFPWPFQCHEVKILPQFLVKQMYLLDKTNWRAMEILG